jgi:hypothetical protein
MQSKATLARKDDRIEEELKARRRTKYSLLVLVCLALLDLFTTCEHETAQQYETFVLAIVQSSWYAAKASPTTTAITMTLMTVHLL